MEGILGNVGKSTETEGKIVEISENTLCCSLLFSECWWFLVIFVSNMIYDITHCFWCCFNIHIIFHQSPLSYASSSLFLMLFWCVFDQLIPKYISLFYRYCLPDHHHHYHILSLCSLFMRSLDLIFVCDLCVISTLVHMTDSQDLSMFGGRFKYLYNFVVHIVGILQYFSDWTSLRLCTLLTQLIED